MADAVFVEQLGHLFRDHLPVVGYGDERNLFPLRLGIWLFGVHMTIVYTIARADVLLERF